MVRPFVGYVLGLIEENRTSVYQPAIRLVHCLVARLGIIHSFVSGSSELGDKILLVLRGLNLLQAQEVCLMLEELSHDEVAAVAPFEGPRRGVAVQPFCCIHLAQDIKTQDTENFYIWIFKECFAFPWR